MTTNSKGFTLVDVVIAVVIFGVVSVGAIYTVISQKNYQRESSAFLRQSAYTTFQASVAAEGIDPSKINNPLGAAVAGSIFITDNPGTASNQSRYRLAGFEANSVLLPTGANTVLAGSTSRALIAYMRAGGDARGLGFGYAVQLGAPAATFSAIPLSAPIFRIYGDLSAQTFPLNNIALLPSTNPAGTYYRYTLDGAQPLDSSPIWNNDPNWTESNFPSQINLRAFNNDPQYSPSASVYASYNLGLTIVYKRADNRSIGLYNFTLNDLGLPSTTGIILAANISGAVLHYTLDGSNPLNGNVYNNPFAPLYSLFTPIAILRVIATSADARYSSSNIMSFQLNPQGIPLPNPQISTDNQVPLLPGSIISINYEFITGTTRTALNDEPTLNSSIARAFPVN